MDKITVEIKLEDGDKCECGEKARMLYNVVNGPLYLCYGCAYRLIMRGRHIENMTKKLTEAAKKGEVLGGQVLSSGYKSLLEEEKEDNAKLRRSLKLWKKRFRNPQKKMAGAAPCTNHGPCGVCLEDVIAQYPLWMNTGEQDLGCSRSIRPVHEKCCVGQRAGTLTNSHTSWANPTHDIKVDLEAVKQRFLAQTGYEPRPTQCHDCKQDIHRTVYLLMIGEYEQAAFCEECYVKRVNSKRDEAEMAHHEAAMNTPVKLVQHSVKPLGNGRCEVTFSTDKLESPNCQDHYSGLNGMCEKCGKP